MRCFEVTTLGHQSEIGFTAYSCTDNAPSPTARNGGPPVRWTNPCVESKSISLLSRRLFAAVELDVRILKKSVAKHLSLEQNKVDRAKGQAFPLLLASS